MSRDSDTGTSQASPGRPYLLLLGAFGVVMGLALAYAGTVGRAGAASAIMGLVLAICGLRISWLGRRCG